MFGIRRPQNVAEMLLHKHHTAFLPVSDCSALQNGGGQHRQQGQSTGVHSGNQPGEGFFLSSTLHDSDKLSCEFLRLVLSPVDRKKNQPCFSKPRLTVPEESTDEPSLLKLFVISHVDPLAGQSEPVPAACSSTFLLLLTNPSPSLSPATAWLEPSPVHPPQLPATGWLHQNSTLPPAPLDKQWMCTNSTARHTCGAVRGHWELW